MTFSCAACGSTTTTPAGDAARSHRPPCWPSARSGRSDCRDERTRLPSVPSSCSGGRLPAAAGSPAAWRRWRSSGSARRGLGELERGVAEAGDAVHGRTLQRMPAGALDGREHLALVAEAHLALGRVHVDVDLEGIELDADHAERVAAGGHQAPVRLGDGGEQRAVVHAPAVDDHDQAVAVAAVAPRLADRAADVDVTLGGNSEELRRLGAEHRAQRVVETTAGRAHAGCGRRRRR